MSYENARGMLRPIERTMLYKIAKQAVPDDGIIVNIGVEYGASLHCFLEGNSSATIIGVDPVMTKYEGPRPHRLVLIETLSEILLDLWHESIDVAFIDGDHGRNGVITDLRWTDYVKIGGYVIFHDCYDWDRGYPHPHGVCPEVNEVVNMWREQEGFKLWKELQPAYTSRVFRRERVPRIVQ